MAMRPRKTRSGRGGQILAPSNNAKNKISELPLNLLFKQAKSWCQRASFASKIVFGVIVVIVTITGTSILQVPPSLKVINTDILRAGDPFSLAVTIMNDGKWTANIKSTKCVFEDRSTQYELPWGSKVFARGEYVDSSQRKLAGGKTMSTPCHEMGMPRFPEKGIYLLRVEYTWLFFDSVLEERYSYAQKDGGSVWLPENDRSD